MKENKRTKSKYNGEIQMRRGWGKWKRQKKEEKKQKEKKTMHEAVKLREMGDIETKWAKGISGIEKCLSQQHPKNNDESKLWLVLAFGNEFEICYMRQVLKA